MTRFRVPAKKFAASAAAGVLLTLAFPAAASADEPVPAPDSGGWSIDVTQPADRLPLSADAAGKMKTALQSYIAAPDRTAVESSAASQELQSVASAETPAVAAAPTSRTLAVTHVAQIESYYCGPASAYMMLEQQGFTTSRDGLDRDLSQPNLAGIDYLQTDKNDATTWKSRAMADGINRWNGGDWSYAQVQSPSAATAQGAITDTIGTHGRPVAADTVEFANQSHYNNHPVDRTIGHWIVGYGYTESGATSSWADPSTSYFTSAAETFSTDTAPFVQTYMQSNGIMY